MWTACCGIKAKEEVDMNEEEVVAKDATETIVEEPTVTEEVPVEKQAESQVDDTTAEAVAEKQAKGIKMQLDCSIKQSTDEDKEKVGTTVNNVLPTSPDSDASHSNDVGGQSLMALDLSTVLTRQPSVRGQGSTAKHRIDFKIKAKKEHDEEAKRLQ